MDSIYKFLDMVRARTRHFMHYVARSIDELTNSKVTANQITLFGLAMHIPIAWLVAMQQNIVAALLLVVFGLFDTLDGELARVQKRDSPAGMLLDASTDRMKEVLLYMGAAYSFISLGHPAAGVWAVAACGASLCVSYVKAKGETAIAKSNLSVSEVNKLFQDGLMRFEVRMFLLIIGLLFNQVILAVTFIAILSTYTAIDRLSKISRKLS